jgi:4-diphosphocytidyl-2-C-methyl-D-erythritol kinase
VPGEPLGYGHGHAAPYPGVTATGERSRGRLAVTEATSNGHRIRVRIPAKINLFLSVRGTRPDGYHELVSVMQTVALHDTVVAELDDDPVAAHPAARRLMALAFSLDGPTSVPPDEDNLAVRAARSLMDALGIGTVAATCNGAVPRTRLHLRKGIPVAAGMAGGSADAAATLLALNHLWEAGLDREALRGLASGLGADVPFCVTGGTALATGTGTATAQILTRGSYHWVVGVSDRPLSTPAVYRAFDEVGTPSQIEPDLVLQALRTGDAEALGAALYNDLEVAATHLRPQLAAQLSALREAGALGVLISGSGPTVLGLAGSAQHAIELAERVRDRFDRVEVAQSPAGGPELLGG